MSSPLRSGRYGLIGYPVSHSLSPDIFLGAFGALGMGASYDLFPIPPGELEKGMRDLAGAGVKGLNVTVPHKTAVFSMMDRLDDSARHTGAVNTIVFGNQGKTGYNTDVGGFSDSLDVLGAPDVKGGEVLVLGAGGAARAVVASLAARGPSRIAIASRSRKEAENLVHEAGSRFPGTPFEVFGFRPEDIRSAAAGAVLCVQATSLGLKPGDPLPAEPGLFPCGCFLFDLVYGPENTPFVRAASALGYRAVDGKEMLLRQAARSFSIWFGREAPVEAMRKAMNRKIVDRSG